MNISHISRKGAPRTHSLLKEVKQYLHSCRAARHENPLGLPRQASTPPSVPRRGALPQKRDIPNTKKVVIVASGKGGVGKSTIAVNLAVTLASHHYYAERRLRVGLLDLDLFGPSIPKLMGLDAAEEPELTSSGALIPLRNHGISCMSMGFLLPRTQASSTSEPSRDDTPVVWRGLMVQKAVQQLLFDVDWREHPRDNGGPGLDVLVVDMPPGTGDVQLTLGQLVNVDGAVIVSTPQDISMSDVRKGIAMFRKVSVPITGLILNNSYFLCPSCSMPHYLFGLPDSFRKATGQLGLPVLGELPLVPEVSSNSDEGVPYALVSEGHKAGLEWKGNMRNVASTVLLSIKINE